MLVTTSRYTVITGDATTAASAVSGALTDAQALLEEHLRRPLEKKARTETMRVEQDGKLYPRVTPIVTITTPAGLQHFEGVIYGGLPDSSQGFVGFFPPVDPPTLAVTYTAGFDGAETDPEAATYLPRDIEAAIAWAAYARLRPSDFASLPAGATSVRLGDAAVTYKAGGTGVLDRQIVWPASVRKYARRSA